MKKFSTYVLVVMVALTTWACGGGNNGGGDQPAPSLSARLAGNTWQIQSANQTAPTTGTVTQSFLIQRIQFSADGNYTITEVGNNTRTGRWTATENTITITDPQSTWTAVTVNAQGNSFTATIPLGVDAGKTAGSSFNTAYTRQ
ncbi:lipocalin family protein [Eisenibacter elegans]|jgi:hypothetical protein|uniref:lipocalin family protein n=1 Tax=Eisenibacter elegans TaxID=997 RepID=UPI00040C027E|nr:lipocalin family protein [Eisenibacter elegans]